jgi:hypothetical protein
MGSCASLIVSDAVLGVTQGGTIEFDFQGSFTKTSDAIPVHPTLQVMTEYADVNDMILKSGAAPSLLPTLKDPDALQYFRSLIVGIPSILECKVLFIIHFLAAKILGGNRSLIYQRHVLILGSLARLYHRS